MIRDEEQRRVTSVAPRMRNEQLIPQKSGSYTDQSSMKEHLRGVHEMLAVMPRNSVGVSEFNPQGSDLFGMERNRRMSPGLSSISPAGYPGHRKNEASVPVPVYNASQTSNFQPRILGNEYDFIDEDMEALRRGVQNIPDPDLFNLQPNSSYHS